MIVTRVLPSLTPEDGKTAVIVGTEERVVPKVKQFRSDKVTGIPVLVPRVTWISTGTDGEVSSGNPGVCSVIVEAVTLVTRASRVMPPATKTTRVVLGEPKKRPPWITSVVPPVIGPKLGSQELMNGPAVADGWKAIVIEADPVSVPTLDVARTTAVPTKLEQSAVSAEPPWVTTETSGKPFWAKKPKSVEKATLVPSGTLFPFSVTIA
jgi:hypothetical protein